MDPILIEKHCIKYPSNATVKTIWLKNGEDLIGVLQFRASGSSVPPNAHLHGLPIVQYRLEDFSNIVYLLKNERPAYLYAPEVGEHGELGEAGIVTGDPTLAAPTTATPRAPSKKSAKIQRKK
jgi:hypothetical protein